MSGQFEIEKMLPELEADSDRQLWYAEQLRHKYILAHEERFEEIYETVMREVDHRDLDYQDENYLATFDLEFTEAERAVLYAKTARGIIVALKEVVNW